LIPACSGPEHNRRFHQRPERTAIASEEAKAAAHDADTQAPFSYKDPCIELHPHTGGNPATAMEARKAVERFPAGVFKLG